MSRRLTKWFSVEEVLVLIFGHNEQGNENEPEIEEDVLEVKDNTDFDPDFEENDQLTDGEKEAPEEGDFSFPQQTWGKLKTLFIQQRQRILYTPASASLVRSVQAHAPAAALVALSNKNMGRKGSTVSTVLDTAKQAEDAANVRAMFARPTFT